MAHCLAGWLGISTGIVIADLLVPRKGDSALRARRKRKSGIAVQPIPDRMVSQFCPAGRLAVGAVAGRLRA